MMAWERGAELFTGVNDRTLLVSSQYGFTMSNTVVGYGFNIYNIVVVDISKIPSPVNMGV